MTQPAPIERPRAKRAPLIVDLNKVPSLMEQRAASWKKADAN